MIQKQFDEKLKNHIHDFSGETIDSELFLHYHNFRNSPNLTFRDCLFKEKVRLERINNEYSSVTFHRCSFESDVEVVNCILEKLQFSFIQKLLEINISGTFHTLYLDSNDSDIDGNVDIENCTIISKLDCSNLSLLKGQFTLNLNNKITDDYDFESFFNNSTFNLLNFSNSYLGRESSLKNTHIITTALFDRCDFKKVYFDNSDFGRETSFIDCKFYSYSGYEKCKNLDMTNIYFRSCLFKSFPHFNESQFNYFEITHTTFQRKVSFDNVEVNFIKLYQVSFHEEAYFNDIKINRISECDKTSLRTIKQELQKTENKIDHSRFRVYEFNAYRKDIKNKLIEFKGNKDHRKREYMQLKRDSFVLWISDVVSEYGTDWKRALKFTLCWGFIAYLFLFIGENYLYGFDWKNWQGFPKGFIRFFLLTDFYNPLADGKTYLQSIWSWIPFIVGKIIIAIGLYEMIQSFRKFKA